MFQFPLFHRDSASLREGRLIHQQMRNTESPSEQPKAVLAQLTDEHVNEADLEKAVVEIPEGSDVYRAVVAEGQKLDQKQRGIVGANLKRLSARIEVRAQTQVDQAKVLAKVERMRTALEPSPELRPVEPAPAPETVLPSPEAGAVSTGSSPIETEKSLWARSWEQAGRYWNETSPAVKAVSIGVGAATLAYGAYRLVKWLWGGTKKVAEQTVEKTKEGMGWLKKTIIGGSLLAVAGIGGYFGIQWLQDYRKRMAAEIKTAVKEGAEAAARKIEAAGSKARTEIAEHGQAAAERVSGAVDAGAKKLDEKRRGLTAEPSTPVSPEGPATKVETAQEKAKEYAPGVAVYLLSKYLKSDKVADVYESLKGRKIAELLGAYDSSRQDADPAKLKAFSVVPAGAEGTEARQYEEAAQKLVAFCGRRGPEARTLYNQSRKPADVPFEDLTLEQYVLSLGGGLALAADAVEFSHDLSSWKPDLSLLKRMKEGALSVGRKMRDLKDQRLSHLSSPLQEIEMKAVLQHLVEADGGVFAQRSVRSVLGAAQVRLTEEQIGRLPPAERQKARIHALVLEVCERALPTGRELLPFFHRTFPDRAWSSNQAANEAVIDQYVQEMSVAQALRFFSYWQMIRSQSGEEQVGGLVALQYEVLQFIDKRDAGYFGGLIKPKFKSAVVGLTEDLASPTFGQAIAEVAKVDAAIVGRACDMLAEPAQRLAYYAGLAALGPVKYLAEWGLGTWEKHPVGAPLVAGAAAYGLLSPVRFIANAPAKLVWWHITRRDPSIAASALKRPWARYNPLRRIYGLFNPAAHYAARVEAGNFLSNVSEKINVLPDEAARGQLRKALDTCLRKGAKDVDLRDFWMAVQKARNSSVRPAAYEELRQVSHNMAYEKGFEGTRKALQLYARPLREQAANLRFVRSMRAAGIGGTALWGAGLVGQGYTAVESWREVGRKLDEKKDVMTEGVNILAEIRAKLEQDGRFHVSPDGRSFVHKESGVVVDLKVAERQLTTVEGALDSGIVAQVGRASTDTAAFVGLALLAPRLALGPAGLMLVGAELAIHGGIAVWEQSKMRNFILHSPPWVIAALGLQKTTGVSEDEWLNNASSWMITDVAKWFEIAGPWGLRYHADPQSAEREWQANEKEKERIRDRALFTLFCSDLRQNAPEVIGEILDGIDTPDAMDQFFEREFRSMILPFLSIALFTHSQGPMRWSNAREVDTDSGWVIVPPRMTMTQLRKAMREASLFALQHVREQRYVKLLALRQQMEDDGLGDQWETAMAQIGAQSAFGQRLRESALTGREQKTRTELLLAEMLDRFNRTRGVARPSLFVVSPESVPGLPSTLDMRSPTVPYDFIEDPAQRLRLSTVRVETLGEEETSKRERWNDWGTHIRRLATPQSWVDALDRLRYAAPFHAANTVAGAIGQEALHRNVSFLDLAQRSPDAASYDAARDAMTDGAAELFRMPDISRRTFERRWTAGAGAMYGADGPLVFGEYHSAPEMAASGNRSYADQIYHHLRYPDVDARGFEPENLRAVFFEGRMLSDGHEVVLATYLYGDITSHRISVLRCAGSTYQVSGLPKDVIIGGVRPVSLKEFLQERGAQDMLRRVREEMMAQRASREKQAQETARARRIADDTWKRDAPQRAATMTAQQQQRAWALERVRSGGIVYVPRGYQVDDKLHRMALAPGSFRGRFGDTDVEMSDIPTEPSMAPHDPNAEPEPFAFHARRGDRGWDFHVTIDALRSAPTPDFTREDQQLARDVLTTPMDLAGHPRAGDAAFVENVRQEELGRILRMVRYRNGNGWSSRDYRDHLFQELWPYYRDAKNKQVFLNTLLNNLLAESAVTGGVFSSPYRRILSNMQHQW